MGGSVPVGTPPASAGASPRAAAGGRVVGEAPV